MRVCREYFVPLQGETQYATKMIKERKRTWLMTWRISYYHQIGNILLRAIFRIDTDTTLTTSISLICSHPFAPVMGSALGNKSVIGPGIAVGLFGYAIGTYMGFGIAQLLPIL